MTENICDRIIGESKSVFVCPIDEICKHMQNFVAFGSKVLFLTDFGLTKAERTERALFKSYRVETVSVPEYTRAFARSVALPEDARAVVCAGDGKAAAVAKYVATRYNRPFVFVALTPDISTVQLPSSMLEEENYSEVYKTEPPVLTLLDSNMEDSETRTAAGFGEVCSRLVAIFDYELSGLMGGEKTNRSVCVDALEVIK
ncbi:MAG: iron-containing alcohol dehydrogenase, partial [Clostridia bacterium]|nr:iron-containing alcohol dehydrogenase [Clostridia bacterium]